MTYTPNPINTDHIQLDPGILEPAELLAENTHDIWAKERIAQGWSYGPQRRDDVKENPCLVPYAQLPESEKVYDRNTALEALKVITAMGYEIRKSAKN